MRGVVDGGENQSGDRVQGNVRGHLVDRQGMAVSVTKCGGGSFIKHLKLHRFT